jgi:hypothetical protein
VSALGTTSRPPATAHAVAGDDTGTTPGLAAARPGVRVAGVVPRHGEPARNARGLATPTAETVPTSGGRNGANAPETSTVPGSSPSAGGQAPRTLHQVVLDALEDDTMTAPEIARQLAKRGVAISVEQLTLALVGMQHAGALHHRTILRRDCWAAARQEAIR